MMQVRAPENQNSALAFADGRDVVITAHVIKEGNLRDHGRGDSQQRLDLETEQINTSNENFAVRFGIRVSFYGYEARDEAAKNVFRRIRDCTRAPVPLRRAFAISGKTVSAAQFSKPRCV